MKPRIRTSVLSLALATLLAVPATASASGWATLFSTPATCISAPGPYTSSASDDITVPVGWQNASVSVALAGTNVDQYQWAVDCGSVTTSASGTAPVTGDGVHTFQHRAREAGTSNWTPWVEDTVSIDTGAPINTTTTSSAWRQGPVTVPLTISDALSPAHGEWKVDGAPSYTVSNTATVSGTGAHTLYTSAIDAAGNRTDVSMPVNVDNTLPVDNTTVPVGWQQDAADLTLAGTDADSGVANVVWQVDSGTVTPGNVGDVLHITANGTHTLKTYVLDNAGNQSSLKTQTFSVDSAGPADTTTVPAGWVTTASTAVTISAADTGGSGVAQIEWQIPEDARSGTQMSGTSIPLTITGEGVHTLRVRLTDGQSHVTGWTDHVIRIDSTLPVDNTSVSSSWQPMASLNVTVHGTDPSPASGVDHIDYKLDGVPATVTGDTGVVAVSGQGEHTLETRISDVAGNSTGWVPHTIRLDSTAPDNTTPVAATAWRNTQYQVVLNGNDSLSGVAAVQWRVDNGVVNEGTTGIETARVTADGAQHLWTRVKDVAGNYSSWRDDPISIDTVKPVDTTTSPATVGNGHKVNLTGTDALSGLSTGAHWQLDNGAVQTTAQATIVGLGTHTLKTQVQDNAGNWSDYKTISVTVSAAAPSEDVDPPVDNSVVPTTWQTGPTTVVVTADDGGNSGVKKVEWRVDGQPIQHVDDDHGSFTVSADGVHDVATRATDNAGNISPWKLATLKIDSTLPVDTTSLPTDWTNSRTVTLTATDATSGVDKIEYTINGGAPLSPTGSSVTITLPSDGTFTIAHRVYDVAGQQTSYKTDTVKVDSVAPTLTSAAAPTGWQTSPLSLDITGTDATSGIDHAEWKLGATGTVTSGTPAVISTDGTPTLYTRVVDKAGNGSTWRTESIQIDTTKPVNTTPAIANGWRKTNLTTSVAGTDATSGVARVEWKLDNAAATPTTTPAVSVTTEGQHTLWSRVVDVAGNVGDWRQDTFGIDKTAPTLGADCGATTWRNTTPVCTVAASGGLSGLPTLTASRNGGDAVAVSGGSYTVDADGAATITFHAVDGAGNEATTTADVKVDRVAPSAGVSCAPGAGVTWLCTATGGDDGGSGLAALSASIDGSAPAAVAPGGTFVVTKGTVVVSAADGAGNVTASAPATLAVRTLPPVTTTVVPRTANEAVLLKSKGSASARLLGQLSIAGTPTATTVDLRPLALGTGKFQFVLKITTGKKTKTVTKTQTTKKGYSTRISVKVPAAATAKVKLTVKKRSGSKWSTWAAGSAKL